MATGRQRALFIATAIPWILVALFYLSWLIWVAVDPIEPASWEPFARIWLYCRIGEWMFWIGIVPSTLLVAVFAFRLYRWQDEEGNAPRRSRMKALVFGALGIVPMAAILVLHALGHIKT